jgi:hypothetical protein
MNRRFKKYLTSKGVASRDIRLFSNANTDAVILKKIAENDNKAEYEVFVMFHRNTKTVEIWIQKKIKTADRLSILEKINELNMKYVVASFCLIDDLLTEKSYYIGNSFDEIFQLYQKAFDTAEKHFASF